MSTVSLALQFGFGMMTITLFRDVAYIHFWYRWQAL
jgi:hypothetical protein